MFSSLFLKGITFAIAVELYLFESTVADILWVYGVTTLPASLSAWRVSAYPAYQQTKHSAMRSRQSMLKTMGDISFTWLTACRSGEK
ncbi:hypothetical protein [Atopomonas hussainii]|uniref:hypothetical protein n=1 Tax=Atopomonas hussainii TaxID=1429083 RepID=UPI0009420B14|nr:hypothetical protein [Atopomonas hussainii]